MAALGYENVSSDYFPFDYCGLKYEQSSIYSLSHADLLKNFRSSFDKYNNTGWKGGVSGQTLGIAAGAKYYNRDNKLPSQSSNGTPITYREFDVNNKLPNAPRDSERFVVGSDGSIYYTNDHYLKWRF